MKVEEIKALVPEAEVITLLPEARYLILAKRRNISPSQALEIPRALSSIGIRAALLIADEFPSIFELKE